MDVAVRESMLAEADMASVFHQILEEQHKGLDQQGNGKEKSHLRSPKWFQETPLRDKKQLIHTYSSTKESTLQF